MIVNKKPNVVPSPAEEVREQEKQFASQLRQQAKDKKLAELNLLSSSLQRRWEKDHNEKCAYLQSRYNNNLQSLGHSHQQAALLQGKLRNAEKRKPTAEEWQKAIERHKKAIHQLITDKENRDHEKNFRLQARKSALEKEKLRAELVAARPPPLDLLMSFCMDNVENAKSKEGEGSFASSHYHLKPRAEKVTQAEQVNAKQSAVVEEEKLKEMFEEMSRTQDEQLEKARLRHKHALSQLKLEEERKKLDNELHLLERLDKNRRRLEVSKIPVQIFQPPHKRQEDAEQCQRDLELAFEQMYMKETAYTGDIAIALDNRSIIDVPGTNGNSFSTSLGEQAESTTARKRETTPPPGDSSEGTSIGTEQPSVAVELEEQDRDIPSPEVAAVQPAVGKDHQDPLKRLLEKIQGQRSRWKTEKEFVQAEELSEGTLTTEEGTDSPRDATSDPIGNLRERFEPTEDQINAPHLGSKAAPTSLLHPLEVAQRLRTPSFSTIPILEKDVIPSQEQLKLQLQKQKLQQQKLERQLQEYREHLQRMYEPTSVSELHQGNGTRLKQLSSLKEQFYADGHLDNAKEESATFGLKSNGMTGLSLDSKRENTEGILASRNGFASIETSSRSSAPGISSIDSSSGVHFQELSARGYSESSEANSGGSVVTSYEKKKYPALDKYYKEQHFLPRTTSNLISVEQIYNISLSNSSSSSITDNSSSQESILRTSSNLSRSTEVTSRAENSAGFDSSVEINGKTPYLSSQIDSVENSFPKTHFPVRTQDTGNSLYTQASVHGLVRSSVAPSVLSRSASRVSSGVNSLPGSNITNISLSTNNGNIKAALEDKTHSNFSPGSYLRSGTSSLNSQMLPKRSYYTTSSTAAAVSTTDNGFSSLEERQINSSTEKLSDVASQHGNQQVTTQTGSSFSTTASSGNSGSSFSGVSEINSNILSLNASSDAPSSLSEMSSHLSPGDVSLTSGSLSSCSN